MFQPYIANILANNPSRLLVGWVIADMSILGLLYYWYKWSSHYIWLLDHIFMYVS